MEKWNQVSVNIARLMGLANRLSGMQRGTTGVKGSTSPAQKRTAALGKTGGFSNCGRAAGWSATLTLRMSDGLT